MSELRESIAKAVTKAINEYRCQHTVDERGDGIEGEVEMMQWLCKFNLHGWVEQKVPGFDSLYERTCLRCDKTETICKCSSCVKQEATP